LLQPSCCQLLLCLQVSYFYDSDLGDFYYGPTHPMKPHRVRMAHDLIVRYDLYKHLQVRLG
jgi:histone deacetylase 1/2